jgi:AmpE protein
VAIALLSVAIVLLLQAAAAELSKLRHFDWLALWFGKLHQRLHVNGFWNGLLGAGFVVAGPTFAIGLLIWVLEKPLFGIIAFCFELLVLFFCLGPRDWREDLDELIHAFTPAQRQQAVAAFGVSQSDQPVNTSSLIEPVLSAALKRQFAPIFWFVCFGASGCVAYRLTQLLADEPTVRPQASAAFIDAVKHLESALAWMPAQLMCLALALASDFDAAARAWKEHHDRHGRGILDLDLGFLARTVRACIDLDDVDEPAETGLDSLALQHTQKLVSRITLTWLLALSVLVLAAYLT